MRNQNQNETQQQTTRSKIVVGTIAGTIALALTGATMIALGGEDGTTDGQ